MQIHKITWKAQSPSDEKEQRTEQKTKTEKQNPKKQNAGHAKDANAKVNRKKRSCKMQRSKRMG